MDLIKDEMKVYSYNSTWGGTDMIKFYTTNSSIIECLSNFLTLNNLEIWI